MDTADSISFAWSRLYPDSLGLLNTTRGKNGNQGFYYPADFIKPVKYAFSRGKSIQLSIYADGNCAKQVLPVEENRRKAIGTIIGVIKKDISSGEGIYFDGVVIDFEELRNTDSDGKALLYGGRHISDYFNLFLAELNTELDKLDKKLYVAVNPRLYYDGYEYGSIVKAADRMIIMAHDYEPTGKLTKSEVLKYTGFDSLNPGDSPAPIKRVKQALEDVRDSVTSVSQLGKVWLQVSFDSAQWRYKVGSIDEWETLDSSALSNEERIGTAYKLIKNRVDNADGLGTGITYGYNNELQCPFIQYFHTADKLYNIILYEDANSMAAKINLAKSFGLGGISVWSLGNLSDYNDSLAKQFHMGVWDSIVTSTRIKTSASGKKNEIVRFSNKVVEQAVRGRLGKASGDIYESDAKAVYRLSLPEGTGDISDLKHLVNLEYLYAQNAGIANIGPLSTLTNLRVLYLQRNHISDIKPLGRLKKLEVLSLNGNDVDNVNALSGLTGLKELYLMENRISSIHALRNLTGLTRLYLGSNRIIDISKLSGLKKLHVLDLGGNMIASVSSLSGLNRLKSLNISNNRVESISTLKDLKSLEVLFLQRNQIKDITSLSALTGLRELSLNGNQLYDVSALEKLTGLKKLYLKENMISDITSLKGLVNLDTLYLSGNKIEDYTPASGYFAHLAARDFEIR
jgi:internalin A